MQVCLKWRHVVTVEGYHPLVEDLGLADFALFSKHSKKVEHGQGVCRIYSLILLNCSLNDQIGFMLGALKGCQLLRATFQVECQPSIQNEIN